MATKKCSFFSIKVAALICAQILSIKYQHQNGNDLLLPSLYNITFYVHLSFKFYFLTFIQSSRSKPKFLNDDLNDFLSSLSWFEKALKLFGPYFLSNRSILLNAGLQFAFLSKRNMLDAKLGLQLPPRLSNLSILAKFEFLL